MDKNSLEDILDAMKSFIIFENQLITIFLLFWIILFMPFLRNSVTEVLSFISYALPDSVIDIFNAFNQVYFSFLKLSFVTLMFLWLPRYLVIVIFSLSYFMDKYVSLQSYSLMNYFRKLLDRSAFIASNLLLIIMLTRTVINMGTIIDFIYDLNHPLAINIIFPIILYLFGDGYGVCQERRA